MTADKKIMQQAHEYFLKVPDYIQETWMPLDNGNHLQLTRKYVEEWALQRKFDAIYKSAISCILMYLFAIVMLGVVIAYAALTNNTKWVWVPIFLLIIMVWILIIEVILMGKSLISVIKQST